VGNQVNVALQTGAGWDLGLERRLDLLGRRLFRCQAYAAGDPVDVGINRHYRPAKGEEEDTGGGLWPNARQGFEHRASVRSCQVPEEAETGGTVLLDEAGETRPYPRRFDVGEAATSDRIGNRLVVRGQDVFPGREGRLQAGERACGVNVGGVLREDRADQLVERVTQGRR
jgi:hypothetical protein